MPRKRDFELPKTVADDPGAFKMEPTEDAGVFRPRRKTLTERWREEGVCTPAMDDAAVTFWRDFQVGCLAGAFSTWQIERVDKSSRSSDEIAYKVGQARDRVNSAMGAVGMVGGSVLWDVIGNEMSLNEYVRRNWSAKLTVNDARGRLLVALDVLANFYSSKGWC